MHGFHKNFLDWRPTPQIKVNLALCKYISFNSYVIGLTQLYGSNHLERACREVYKDRLRRFFTRLRDSPPRVTQPRKIEEQLCAAPNNVKTHPFDVR